MFYMYEHPFRKVVTSDLIINSAVGNMFEHPFRKVVTSVPSVIFFISFMYEHPFRKVVTSGFRSTTKCSWCT